MRRRVCGDPLGPKTAGCLNPPNPIGWDIQAIFVLKVHRRQHAGGYSRQSKHDGQDAGLGCVFHAN
jgi:hypothetical protein